MSSGPPEESKQETAIDEPPQQENVADVAVEKEAAEAAEGPAEAPAEEAEAVAPTESPPPVEEGAIWEPADNDILSGRGAAVNAHNGNKKFRALCFARKPEFEAANHAAKRRVATEIVTFSVANWGSRFLKRRHSKGPWYELNNEKAIQKACQVMRDHERPDRVAQRKANPPLTVKKRNRATATPMDDITIPPPPLEPIVENPFGVHDHDVICGRGAYVNGHTGNQRLRKLAIERKTQFDKGNYTEKRSLATEIVTYIRSLDPPGRFLRKVNQPTVNATEDEQKHQQQGTPAAWEELPDERAIHKACQVMRDIDRPDRKHRAERRMLRKLKKEGKLPDEQSIEALGVAAQQVAAPATGTATAAVNPMAILAETTTGSAAVDEAVAAAAEAMDQALEAASQQTAAAAAAATLSSVTQNEVV